MITYLQLGNMGRMGNQLFELSSLIGIANKNNLNWVVPSNWYYKNIFNIPKEKYYDIDCELEFTEKNFHYDPITITDININININGYFQSWRYFQDSKSEILSYFKSGKIDHTKCFVHVRRGDYVNQQDYHPVQEPNYFHQAMDIIHNEYGISNFKFFSDDIPWCRQHFLGVDFSSGSSEVEDFKEMLSCGAGIISNSSFSWWAGYLINTGKVIAPRKWFGKNYAHYKTEDLYYPGWKII
jgi:hypothetical protein